MIGKYNICYNNYVDLNKELQKGLYFMIGTFNNQWYDENEKICC